MSETVIIYSIAGGCVIFGIITAYLIYNFVQQEKAQYYKYKLRKQKMKENPTDYNYVAPKEKKKPISDPIVAAVPPEEPKETKKPESRGGVVPLPAPVLAPVHLPPLPTATPPAPAAPVPTPSPPPKSSHVADPLIPAPVAAAAVGGAAGGAAAFATYEVARNDPEPEQKQSKNKKEKKRRGSVKKVSQSDFDDYRNLSPTVLPPPKGAPPPPKANYTGGGSNHAPPVSDDVQSVVVETGGRSRGRPDLPKVSVVTREGLAF